MVYYVCSVELRDVLTKLSTNFSVVQVQVNCVFLR